MNLKDRLGSLSQAQTLLVASAGLAAIAVVYFIIAALAGLPPLGDDSPSSDSELLATVTPPTVRGTPTPDRGLDLELVTAYGCEWSPPSAPGPVARLGVKFTVKNTFGRYLGPIRVESTGGLDPWSEVFQTDTSVEWKEVAATRIRYFTRSTEIGISADDLGKPHEVVLHVDPENNIEELDEANNTVTIIAEMPADPPKTTGTDLPCRPPEPTPIPATPTP